MSVSRLDVLLTPAATSVEFLFLSSFASDVGAGGCSKLTMLPLRPVSSDENNRVQLVARTAS